MKTFVLLFVIFVVIQVTNFEPHIFARFILFHWKCFFFLVQSLVQNVSAGSDKDSSSKTCRTKQKFTPNIIIQKTVDQREKVKELRQRILVKPMIKVGVKLNEKIIKK